MNENQLIQRLTQSWRVDPTVQQGVGDDCAVLRGCSSHHWQLFKTDAVVEGRHFTAQTPAPLIGRKALARVLSDFAAMGGTPRYAVVTLGLPENYDLRRLQKIYHGLTALAQQYKVNLVGGETTRSRDLFLSIAAWGETQGFSPVLRSTAGEADLLFVTGTLGGTQKRHHLTFTPRLAEGAFLAKNKLASALMDLSDGLGSDLPRLSAASGLHYDVDLNALPLTRGTSIKQACTEGEDYELLFTVPPRKVKKLHRLWEFRTKLTCIGRLIPHSALRTPHSKLPYGFDHLR